MTPALNLKPEHQNLLLQLLSQYLPGVEIWAFGSRVKGTARATSDLDFAVFAEPDQKPLVFALHEALEESNLPFKVDLLIWHEIPESFKSNIQQQYVALVKIAPGTLFQTALS